MSSPSIISRSSSFPRLKKTWPSQYTLPEDVPHANRSACSAPTLKIASVKLSWGRKIRRLIGRRGNSELTEQSLEVYNKTLVAENVVNHHKRVGQISLDDYYKGEIDDERSSKYSPYYIRGLTYPSIIVPKDPIANTPGHESNSSAVTWTSISTFFSGFKVREWSSCLGSRTKEYNKNLRPEMYTTIKPSTHSTVNASPKNSETSLVEESIERKEVMKSSNEYNKEKPLRERVRAATRPKNEIKVMNEAQKEYAWADKYQPLCLEDFICNKDKATQLQALARGGACGHFIFEGPPGVGKRTMIWAMLREAFGRDTIHAREEFKAFSLKGEMVGSIEVHVKQSPQHVEVNLSELKGYEKHVIVELMRETQDKTTNKALPCGLDNCRAIILYEADKLSTDALLYIKWLLERYKGCNKVFFCCSDVSKLQAIKSLCTVVELLPPSKTETVAVLKFIAKQEGIDLPQELAERFAENSKNNFCLAIRSFEATWKKCYPFKENQVILTGWEDNIADIAKNMIEEQSPKQLYIIRGKLQNLIVHGVCPEFIFQSLVAELKKHLDDSLQDRIESMYDEYNRNDENMFESDKYDHEEMSKRLNDHSRKSIKQFLRIEEFIAKFMSCYKGCTNTKSLPHDGPT
ncbi:hypothetical protein PRUPE_2G108000 [Prunus persica]|uniref:AAA+ ATPase domain-containing protein n=1 Tax=Prunus persica TaxID=3760 RepID=A0A251QED1_PRUPE|nr:replication factor C subunit 3 [Prunus persica]ONI22112.1 hypothetical protein PRUPE_2G108000 [Prunus persica]